MTMSTFLVGFIIVGTIAMAELSKKEYAEEKREFENSK